MKLFGAVLEAELYASSLRKTLPAGAVVMQSNSCIRSIPVVLNGSLRVMRQDDEGK